MSDRPRLAEMNAWLSTIRDVLPATTVRPDVLDAWDALDKLRAALRGVTVRASVPVEPRPRTDYEIVRDAVEKFLPQFVFNDDIAEPAIMAEAIEKAGHALRAGASAPPPEPSGIREAIAALSDGELEIMLTELQYPSGLAFHRDTLRRYLARASAPVEPSPEAVRAAIGAWWQWDATESMEERIEYTLRAAYAAQFGSAPAPGAAEPEGTP